MFQSEDKVVPVSGAAFGLWIRILGEKLGNVPSVPEFVVPEFVPSSSPFAKNANELGHPAAVLAHRPQKVCP